MNTQKKTISSSERVHKYNIQNSLPLDNNTQVWETVPVAGNLTTWTFATWFKRTALNGVRQDIFGKYVAGAVETQNTYICFDVNDCLCFYHDAVLIFKSDAIYRDVTQWMHLTVTLDMGNATTNSRILFYVNGTLLTGTYTSVPAQGTALRVNTTGDYNTLFGNMGISYPFYGFVAETYFIDGTVVPPTTFGLFSPLVPTYWIPKLPAASLSFGTIGYRLEYKINHSIVGYGYDTAGIHNTGTNPIIIMGVTPQIDTPTNNACILNYLDGTGTVNSSQYNGGCNKGVGARSSTFFVNSGKWHWVFGCDSVGLIGIISSSGVKYTFTTADVGNGHEILFDADLGILDYNLNGGNNTNVSSSIPPDYYSPYFESAGTAYFNEGPNMGYSPTYKSLCAKNLPDPVTLNCAQAVDAKIFTATGAAMNITSFSMLPDFILAKDRTLGTSPPITYNTLIGTGKYMCTGQSNTGAAAVDATSITAFTSNGFNLGVFTNPNTASDAVVAHSWVANIPEYGFGMITYTGSGVAKKVTHNLGGTPEAYMVKTISATTGHFTMYHKDANTSPETGGVYFSYSNAWATDAALWNNTKPTSTNINVGTMVYVNTNNASHILWTWRSIDGLSKIGGYVGNNAAEGKFVYCGFRPRIVYVRASYKGGDWMIVDAARNPVNPINKMFLSDQGNAETATTGSIEFVSNGFKIRGAGDSFNAAGQYIYMAWAESPFKYTNGR